MDIYPSVLETTVEEFSASIMRLSPHFDYIQLDIADGIFVPNTTVQIEDIQKTIESHPNFINKEYEFHLMVQDYLPCLKQLADFQNIHVRRALVHLKVLQHTFETLRALVPFQVGVVLNPDEEIDANWEKIQLFPLIQLMTCVTGYQGTPFVPEQLDKIAQLREKGYKGVIILDGSINEESMKQIVQKPFLPDVVCPGSYFKAENIAERLCKLNLLAGIAANEIRK